MTATADNQRPLSILCIASFFKGEEFMRAAKEEGCTVYLMTSSQLQNADWPRAHLDDVFYINDINGEKGHWNMDEVINGLAWVMRSRPIDRIVSLDDFDVEKGAALREHFRIDAHRQLIAEVAASRLTHAVNAEMLAQRRTFFDIKIVEGNDAVNRV